MNNLGMRISSAIDGLGLSCVPEDQVLSLVKAGQLVRVLGDWCPPFRGYHLYYTSRRYASAAFGKLIEALRYRKA